MAPLRPTFRLSLFCCFLAYRVPFRRLPCGLHSKLRGGLRRARKVILTGTGTSGPAQGTFGSRVTVYISFTATYPSIHGEITGARSLTYRCPSIPPPLYLPGLHGVFSALRRSMTNYPSSSENSGPTGWSRRHSGVFFGSLPFDFVILTVFVFPYLRPVDNGRLLPEKTAFFLSADSIRLASGGFSCLFIAFSVLLPQAANRSEK